MKTLLPLAPLAFTVLCAFGDQAAARPAPAALQGTALLDPDLTVERILRECLTRGHSYQSLRSLVRVAPHRLSGSQGATAAVQWAYSYMSSAGFENVRLEPVMVPHWERGEPEELVITAPSELAGEVLSVLALGGSIATPPEGLEAELVMVSDFSQLAFLKDRCKDKIIFFNRQMNPGAVNTFKAYGEAVSYRVNGAVEAAKAGGVGSLVRSVTTRKDDVPHTGAMRYLEGVERIPSAAISTKAADRLADLLATGVEVRVRLRMSCVEYPPAESHNVVGEIIGREKPEEVVVVGGHLDGWDVGDGAHDDGAGCVQAMEAVRLMFRLGIRPRRTVRCVLFMNEENGLAGANGYYRDHLEEMGDHVFAIESDRGAFTPRGFSVTASDEALEQLRPLIERMQVISDLSLVAGGSGADIGPMAQSGVPLAGFVPDGQRYFDFHHSARDVLHSVHPRELELGTAAITALAWQVAELSEPLHRQPPAAKR